MRQILDNNATISSNVQKSHSVPNVNGHMQNQQHNRGRQQNSNKNNGNACPDHNEINEGTKKFSFNSADGDDPGMFLNSIIYYIQFKIFSATSTSNGSLIEIALFHLKSFLVDQRTF